jgi:hypothetical protein
MIFFPENEIAKTHSSVNEFFSAPTWPPGYRPGSLALFSFAGRCSSRYAIKL